MQRRRAAEDRRSTGFATQYGDYAVSNRIEETFGCMIVSRTGLADAPLTISRNVMADQHDPALQICGKLTIRLPFG
jgi:hypothetical protein